VPGLPIAFFRVLAVVATVTTSGQGEYGRLDSLLVEGVDEVAATAQETT
jgi:hypothetical protein